MIIRSWKATALPKNVAAYARHFSDSVLLRRDPRHKGAYLLKKNAGASVELVVLTLWDTMDAIHNFAGKRADEAVVEPAAQAVLETFDRSVQHFEVVLSSSGTTASVTWPKGGNMHYLLFYEFVPDYVARRAPFRSAHLLAAWKAQARGELILAGAYADPVDGAALLFRCASRTVPEHFVASDPYVIGGLVTRWHIREWTTVVGEDATTPVRPGM